MLKDPLIVSHLVEPFLGSKERVFPSKERLLISLATTVFGYVVLIVIYRLFFSGLAHVPGPKLAAATRLYELYYDVILGGKFTMKIQELHEKYGPIVRISPFELHINDHQYHETLYSLTSPRNKSEWFVSYMNVPKSTFATVDHNLHRLRRTAISPHFSKQKVTSLEPLLRSKVKKLCERIREFSGTRKPLPIEHAYHCFTTDVITEYTCGQCWNYLDTPDLFPEWHTTIKDVMEIGMIARHIPWIIVPLFLLPEWLVSQIYPKVVRAKKYRRKCDEVARSVYNWSNSDEDAFGKESSGRKPLFNELAKGRLPPEERTEERISHEIVSVVGAATDTTANTLSMITFHILDKPERLTKLRNEIGTMMDDEATSINKLEQLPYLAGVIFEGLRLAYGLSHRSQRSSPEGPLYYKDIKIPPNTPVGMTSVMLHHDEAIFPNSYEFMPERWMDLEDRKRLNKYLVAFGRGSRQCVGMNLAWANLYLTVATLFTTFNMELYKTSRADVDIKHDMFLPHPQKGSLGVRVLIE